MPITADQVVKLAVGQTFDVQIDGRAVECQVRKVGGVDFVLADCERSQGWMKFLRFMPRASTASARAKRACFAAGSLAASQPWRQMIASTNRTTV